MLEQRGFALPSPEQGDVYIYIETTKPIDGKTYYREVMVLAQIIALTEQILVLPEKIEIAVKSFDEVLQEYGSNQYSNPDVRFNGMGELHNSFEYLPSFFSLINKLNDVDLDKFLNGLYTFGLAKELERYPNPHLKHTLQITLYVSVLNQLANNVTTKCGGELRCKCSKCKTELVLEHRGSSETVEIRNLLNELFADAKPAVKLQYQNYVMDAYGKVRSGFLHSGKLSGMEMDGGTFEYELEQIREPVESLVNLQMIASRALRQLVIKRSNYEEQKK